MTLSKKFYYQFYEELYIDFINQICSNKICIKITRKKIKYYQMLIYQNIFTHIRKT